MAYDLHRRRKVLGGFLPVLIHLLHVCVFLLSSMYSILACSGVKWRWGWRSTSLEGDLQLARLRSCCIPQSSRWKSLDGHGFRVRLQPGLISRWRSQSKLMGLISEGLAFTLIRNLTSRQVLPLGVGRGERFCAYLCIFQVGYSGQGTGASSVVCMHAGA